MAEIVSPVNKLPTGPYVCYAANPIKFRGKNIQNSANGTNASSILSANLERSPEADTVSFKSAENSVGIGNERTVEEKQAIVKKARNRASAFSTFVPFGGTTAYYALRSDEKIAQKYNLDTTADKELIDKIRKTQVKWTVPSLLGLGSLGWFVSLISSKDRIVV